MSKRVIAQPSSSSEEDTSEIDTESVLEKVFETTGERFRINGPGRKKAIVEFSEKMSNADCDFTKHVFKVLHAENISRAKKVTYATTKSQSLNFLE